MLALLVNADERSMCGRVCARLCACARVCACLGLCDVGACASVCACLGLCDVAVLYLSRMYLFHIHGHTGAPFQFTTDGPVQLVIITESLRIFVRPARHFTCSLATSCTLTHGMVLRVPCERAHLGGTSPEHPRKLAAKQIEYQE